MNLSVKPVRVLTGSDDEDGRLVFADDHLVAVLVQLSCNHPDAAGKWYLEAGFGRLDGPEHPIFPDVEAAQAWAEARLVSTRTSKVG